MQTTSTETRRGEETWNMRLVGHTDMNGHGDGMHINLKDGFAFVAHMGDSRVGTSIVDVSDPTKPRVVNEIHTPAGTHSHKVQIVGDILVVNNEKNPEEPAAADWAVDTASVWSRVSVAALLVTAISVVVVPLLRAFRSGKPFGDVATRVQVPAWAAVTVALGLVPINAHAWYAIWPLAPLALLSTTTKSDRFRGLLALCFVWIVVSFLIYHTWIA